MTAENTISSEELAKDKYLLELIFNNYYEQERRFQTLESKISSMISFIGVIFTIQSHYLQVFLFNYYLHNCLLR